MDNTISVDRLYNASMTVLYRPATLADAPAIGDVYLASRKRFLPYAPLAHSDAEVRDWITQLLRAGADLRVAMLDGELSGFLLLARAETCGWIEQLFLHPRAVGQGIGSRFVEQAKAALGAPIRLYTFQANTGARRFYECHGFAALALGDGSENEEHCPDVLYEWVGCEAA